jgi:hypothetical protein
MTAWPARLLWIAALAFVLHRALVPMEETDLFFHLAIGEQIVARHEIPFRNQYSFTWPDHPDPDLSWAFQVAVALVYRAGGFPGIVLLKALLIALALALVHRAARARGAGPLAAAAATLLALWGAEQRLVERPHLVTFVGIGALLVALDPLARRPRRLWLLAAGALVWANFHAGVFFAPLVTGLFAAGLWLEGRLAGEDRLAPAAALAAAAAGAAVAALGTPAGLRLVGYLRWHTGLGSTRNVEEFRAADPLNDPGLFVLALLVVLTLLALRRRAPWRWALPALVTFPLALRSVRFAAEWSLLAAPLAAVGLEQAAAFLRARAPRARRAGPGPRAAALLAAALGVAGLLAAERRGHPLRLGLAPDVVPFDAIAFATRTGLRERMFHNLDVGCYLLWEGWPRYRVFQDARLPAYPDDFHRALDRTPLAPAAFDALLRRYGVDAALLNHAGVNMRAGSFDPDEWALVYVGRAWRRHDALVFARRAPRHAAVIAAHEVPLRPRFTFADGTWLEPLWEPPPATPVPPCEWLRRLAAVLETEGRPAEALVAQGRALVAGCLGPADETRVRARLGALLAPAPPDRAAHLTR